ncbi:MAG: sugar ABC transporter permease [Candidatus Eremiobacteraeota bacterium]|nr:sugar ABC transporter permease [Candidatus Eremiobacteraeota bacterium]
MKKSRKDEALKGYLFAAPFLLYFALFTAWPLYYCIKLVFFQFNLGGEMPFVGLKYVARMCGDEVFFHAWRNTLAFVLINVPLQVGIALLLAVALNSRIAGKAFFRAAYFFPVIISGAVTTILWLYLLNKDSGIINQILGRLFGMAPIGWLTSESLAIFSLAVHATWKNVGFTVIILLAGLQSIPRSVYEAAELDGVTPWESFWRITLPLLNPTFVMVVMLSTMGAFSLFVEPLVMTNFGGPGDASMSLFLYIYKKFSFWDMNYASVLGLTTALVILAVVVLQKKFLEKEPYF